MRKSQFKEPKQVLIFNGAKTLIAIVRSLHSVSDLTNGNLQAISFACTGRFVSSGGFYMRHVHPDIQIEMDDLDRLNLEEYDKMCKATRRYYSVRHMAKMKEHSIKLRQEKLAAYNAMRNRNKESSEL